jgi:hypothetical protein
MQGHAFANERMKRFIELGGFHRLSLMEMGDDWVLSRREVGTLRRYERNGLKRTYGRNSVDIAAIIYR